MVCTFNNNKILWFTRKFIQTFYTCQGDTNIIRTVDYQQRTRSYPRDLMYWVMNSRVLYHFG